MHTMSLTFGPTIADGYVFTDLWGSMGLKSASNVYTLQHDFFTITFGAGATIVGSSNAHYAGVDGVILPNGITFTWAGLAQLVGISSVAVTVAAAATSPASGMLTVGGVPLTITAAGTYTASLGGSTGPVMISATPTGWQLTSIVFSYTTKYPDGSTA